MVKKPLYMVYEFSCYDEILIAKLFELGFESFEEKEDVLDAYIQADDIDGALALNLEKLMISQDRSYTTRTLEQKNWNDIWESNFSPVKVDDFCTIIATFHKQKIETKYVITIDPKMAFGTGHHETTFMMIQLMKDISFTHKYVLDYGCGSGILSVLAAKLDAKSIDAIDIEEESYTNTIENCLLNKVEGISCFQGTLPLLSDKEYDIILANINRNVLLASAKDLAQMSKSKGTLLLSGILLEDEDIICDHYIAEGFKIQKKLKKGNWMALKMIR